MHNARGNMESGWDGLGPDLMDTVAHLERCLSQQVSILLGGQQSGQGQQIVVGGAFEDREKALGLGFLLGRKLGLTGHG
jgi:hypothetical protein